MKPVFVPLYAILSGFKPSDVPGIGTFYDFFAYLSLTLGLFGVLFFVKLLESELEFSTNFHFGPLWFNFQQISGKTAYSPYKLREPMWLIVKHVVVCSYL